MTIDTKKLYDLLEDAGVAVVADYGEGLTYSSDAEDNAVDIWRRAILFDNNLLSDVFDDAICDVMEDRDTVDQIRSNMALTFHDLKRMQEVTSDNNSFHAVYGTSVTQQLASIGRLFLLGVHKSVTDYLERNKEEWLCDIAGYVRDMEFDDRGDWEYERMVDRKLEERA